MTAFNRPRTRSLNVASTRHGAARPMTLAGPDPEAGVVARYAALTRAQRPVREGRLSRPVYGVEPVPRNRHEVL